MIDEIKRLINEYNSSGENKIWINLDLVQLIRKFYEEDETTKSITYRIYLNTIKIDIVWTLYKSDGETNINVYIDYLYNISCYSEQ